MGDIGMADKSKAPGKVQDAAVDAKTNPGTPVGSLDAGPGTNREAPKDETRRSQARMHVGAGHVAAPIEAPDAPAQTDPPEGHARSSTNPVAALAGRRTTAGENHVQFVGEDGEEVAPEAVFEPHGENQTFRVAAQPVYEVFNYQGSQEPMSRRLFYKGQRVDLATAARLASAQELGQAQLAQEDEQLAADNKAFHAAS